MADDRDFQEPHTPIKYLTRAQLGKAVFDIAKADVESRGFSLVAGNFDPSYPVSLRTLFYIRAGKAIVETLNKVPGVEVAEFYALKTK